MDRGRAAIAAAEEIAFGGTALETPIPRRDVERSMAEVVDGPWWRSCAVAVTVVTPRRDARSSSARAGDDGIEIRITDEQLTGVTVAHELAHALAGPAHGHDDTYRAGYIDIVAVLVGADAAARLAGAFVEVGIAAGGRRWPPPYRAAGDGFVVIRR
jgi:hypothetical protein